MTEAPSVPSVDDPAASVWRIGENLPWTAPWTGERRFWLQPSEGFPGLTEIVQATAPGEGEPMLSGMNVMRQRLGVTRLLCHVCGKPTPKSDRYLFPTATGTFLPMANGEQRYVSHLPPTHAACAERAMRLCPHLRTRYARPVRFPTDEGRIRPETSLPDSLKFLEAQIPRDRPVVYSYYRIYSPAFSRLVQRVRAEHAAGDGTREGT